MNSMRDLSQNAPKRKNPLSRERKRLGMKYRKTGMTTRAIDYRGIIYSMNETYIFHNKLVSNKMN